MDFNKKYHEKEWLRKYNLAKKYYEHYGNWKIPRNFKTINGVDYDENGFALGSWIDNQKQSYNGNGTYKITKERIRLLEEIGVDFNIRDNKKTWMDKYNLAKKYYEHYGNLRIPQSFQTINGVDYDEDGIALGMWLKSQKQAYTGKGTYKITEEQIRLFEDIGIVWLTSKTDEKLQKEEINSNNIKRKEKEITNRVYSYLGKIDNNDTLTKEKINEGFIDELNKNFKR